MSERKDLTGQTFGRLTVTRRSHYSRGSTYWECACICGNVKAIRQHQLISGETQSCGCLRRELNSTHGKSNTNLYRRWIQMKTRCYRPSYHQYHDYGGRGIRVCDEWRDNFKAFHDWAMANGYSKDLTLDRRDNDGNYTPDNCRWATRNEQQKNRRMPIIRNRGIGGRKERQITVGNETHSFVEWSNLTGIPRKTIKSRYYRGIRDNDLIALTPRQKQRANASPTKVER